MILITKEIRKKLIVNRIACNDENAVLKLFTTDAGCTWLITQLDEDGDTLWGLCDLGMGFIEYGTVSLTEIQTVRGRLGLPVERDRSFKGAKVSEMRQRETLAGC